MDTMHAKWVEEYRKIRPLYEQYTQKLETLIAYLLKKEGIGYHLVETRTKSIESFAGKIETPAHRQSYVDPLKEITDLSGIRIVVYYIDDVDRVARFVEREFAVDRANSIDKGATLQPHEFGYRSVHYVIGLSKNRQELSEWCDFKNLKAEIQIRTVLQHAWAAIDQALRYKKETDVPLQARRKLFRLSGLLELADEQFYGIREELGTLKDESRKRIAAEDTELEVNALTLTEYVRSSKKIALLLEIASKNGFRIREDTLEDFSLLSTLCIDAGLLRISQLDAFLDSVIDNAPEYLKRTREASRSAGWIATASYLLMYLLVATHQEVFSNAYLTTKGWSSSVANELREHAGILRTTKT